MAIEKAGRLSLEFDSQSGLLVNARVRPSGFRLPINETPLLDKKVTVRHKPTVEKKSGYLILGGNRAERPILESASAIIVDGCSMERSLRCAQMSFIQRVEGIEFDYQLQSDSNRTLPLLRVLSVEDISNFPGETKSFWVQSFPYKLNFTFEAVENATCSFHQDQEGGDVDLTVKWFGEAHICVSVLAISVEAAGHDGISHGVIYPFSIDVLNQICTSPPVLGSLLQYAPQFRLSRPVGPLFILPPRDKTPFSHVPIWSSGPVGVILRTSLLVVFHGESPLVEVLDPAFAYLQSLEASQLSSLLGLLWLSSSPEFLQELGVYMERRGPVELKRLESHVPTDCKVIGINTAYLNSEEIFGQIDAWSKWLREMHKATALNRPEKAEPLPPITIPREAPLPFQIALMSAARLHWGPAKLIPGQAWPADIKTWPEMPSGKGYKLTAEVAECFQADVLTHAALLEKQQDRLPLGLNEDPQAAYRQTWREIHRLVRSGQARAERFIFLTLDRNNESENLLKSLPVVSYSSDVPAPVISFFVEHSDQKQVYEYLTDYIAALEKASSRIWNTSGVADDKVWRTLDRKRERLQSALVRIIPPEYLALLKQMRPSEIIAFTNLPLEWLELGGIPLGYLTKVAKIRVESRHGAIPGLFHLMRVYNSLIIRTDRPQGEPFDVLCVAPQYAGANQKDINASIASTLDKFQARVQKQIAVGREIMVETLKGLDLTAAQVKERLKKRRDLIFFIGHADQGELAIGNTMLEVEQIPEQGFEGAVVILIGCTTDGWRSLSTSVANEMFARGARAVFSVPIKLHIRMAQEMVNNLFTYLLQGNWHFAEVLQVHRFSVIYTCAWLYTLAFVGEHHPEIYAKYNPEKTFFISEADTEYASFQNGWDAMYQHYETQFTSLEKFAISGSEILRRMAPFGLTLTFNGRLRDRLFTF